MSYFNVCLQRNLYCFVEVFLFYHELKIKCIATRTLLIGMEVSKTYVLNTLEFFRASRDTLKYLK